MNNFKMFTVETANQLIPVLNKLLGDLQTKKNEILKREVEIDAMELIGGKDTAASPEIRAQLEAYESTVNEFYNIIDEIHRQGCLLKDVDTGLVDFYSLHNGRVVYLCWRLGEEEVTTWHEIGRGFMHRQPIRADYGSQK